MTTVAFGRGGTIYGDGPFPLGRHRADIYDLVVGVLLVIFLLFFFVGAKFQALGLPARIEDFIFLLLLPLGYRYVLRRKTPLFFWIAAYFGVNLIPYVAALVAGEYSLGLYPVILLKELQYFYIAFLICENRLWWVLGAVDGLALFIIFYGLRELLAGRISYYGIGTIGTDSPSLSGALYLFSTIWLHIRIKLLPTRVLRAVGLIAVFLGMACVVATISRSSIVALVVYITVYLLLARIIVFPAFLAALGLTPWLIQVIALSISVGLGIIAQQVVRRASVEQLATGTERTLKWIQYLQTLEPVDFIFGRGTGYPNSLGGGYGLGVDSQYVRLAMERGIAGFVIVAAMLLTILVEIKRRGGEYQHAWAIVISMLVLSIPLEALQVSKSGGFFWLVMFYLLMCQRRRPPALAVA
ncbi:MAG TPA: hypothetical protein VIF32_13360 [Gemmatimonadaceae bacterium]